MQTKSGGGGCVQRIEVILKMSKKVGGGVQGWEVVLVHKGGKINNVQLITGVRIAEMSQLQNCSVKIFKEQGSRYFTRKRNRGCKLR